VKAASPQTSSGAPRLSEVARKLVVPSGIVATGWPAVRDTCMLKLGVLFDPWQDQVGRLVLSKREDDKLAVMIGGVGMSLPRQVGKTYLIGAMSFALCINNPGMLVIWSSHHARTHGETFMAMQAFAKRTKVQPYVRQVFTGSGDEEIRFLNESRILFGARERGFGRGVPGVDMIVMDEAQIMSDKALDAQLATMNTSRFGLAIYVGTPPRLDDPSEVFSRMRKEAWAGLLEDAAWVEFGADPGAHPDDWAQVKIANPSYPRRTPRESILRLRRKLKPDSFLREGLGIWDDDALLGAIPYGPWLELADADAVRGSAPLFGVDVAQDRAAWISVLWRREDGRVHVMLANDGRPLPAHRLVDECARLVAEWGGDVVAPPAFEDDFDRAGVNVVKTTAGEFAVGCGLVADAVAAGSLRHGNQEALNLAVKSAVWRSAGSQAERAFQLKDSPEVGPLAAVARGLWGLENYVPMPAIY
jgi:hypothetical protein